jgi:hypothetical protein
MHYTQQVSPCPHPYSEASTILAANNNSTGSVSTLNYPRKSVRNGDLKSTSARFNVNAPVRFLHYILSDAHHFE